ncbi:hypothetical protein BRD13_02385 [Halobacteriales archaeon SW_5_70_135]|nr:MAG: hypothetical protein BRD13_02385 [Halobacteriales archaeon SW_5_70_135]
MSVGTGGPSAASPDCAGERGRTVGRGLLAVVAVVALTAAAGCAAPQATETDAATPTVETRGGDLSFDPGAEYARLRSLLGTNVSAPPSVTVLDGSTLPENENDTVSPALTTPASHRAFGVEREPAERESLRYRYVAATSFTGEVRLYPGEKPRSLVRTVLVHEYVHYVQVTRGDLRQLRERLDTRTTDGQFVHRSVVEGVAVTVTDAYVRRHLDAAPNSALYERVDEAVSRGTPAWYGNAAYRYGARYVDGRAANASAAFEMVERPPRTSEQVIHGHAPGEEPPRNLSVSVDAAGSDWRAIGRDRTGHAVGRARRRRRVRGRVRRRALAARHQDRDRRRCRLAGRRPTRRCRAGEPGYRRRAAGHGGVRTEHYDQRRRRHGDRRDRRLAPQ